MKCFMSFFGCKFTVPKVAINRLAAGSVPPIVGRIEHVDRTLDCWCKDLVSLLTGQIANKRNNQPAGFSRASVDFFIGAHHGQGSFRAGVEVICRKADRDIAATAVHGLGEPQPAKDAGDLLALAFCPKLSSALKKIVNCERDENESLTSHGKPSIHKKAMEGNEGEEGASTSCAILDRTGRLSIDDTLFLALPIHVFITSNLAFCATAVGKEGADKAHCLWCKLEIADWQNLGQARPGTKWTLEETKRALASLGANNQTSENGVKRSTC